MESVLAAMATGVLALIGVIVSNGRTQAVVQVKIDELTKHVEKRNRVVERTYTLEQNMTLAFQTSNR